MKYLNYFHPFYSDKNINNRIKRKHAKIENRVLKFRCSNCYDFLPATTDYFHLDSGRLKCKCKKCWIGRYEKNKSDSAILKQRKLYESLPIRVNSCV